MLIPMMMIPSWASLFRSHLPTWAAGLVVSSVLLLSSCIVVRPGGSDYVDYPTILAIDAVCDDQGYFELWAEVDHEDGPLAVLGVWVEVSFVFYDELDIMELDYWGSVDLEYLGDAQWAIVLPPGDVLLDCDYPYEYHFGFFAEDLEGDVSGADLIN